MYVLICVSCEITCEGRRDSFPLQERIFLKLLSYSVGKGAKTFCSLCPQFSAQKFERALKQTEGFSPEAFKANGKVR